MEKFTQEQITAVDKVLIIIGIIYIDIRAEMTDHIASELESMDGDFNDNLAYYISSCKKQLRRQSTRSVMVAWIDSWKTLAHNVFTFRFAGMVGSIFVFLLSLYLYMDTDLLNVLMLMSFSIANACVSLPGVITVFKKKEMYSTGEGLGILNLFIFFPGIFATTFINNSFSGTVVLLYFAVLIALSLMLGSTLKSIKGQIKLTYHG